MEIDHMRLHTVLLLLPKVTRVTLIVDDAGAAAMVVHATDIVYTTVHTFVMESLC